MQRTISVVIENSTGKILALRRSIAKKWYPKKWDIVSGKIAENESPYECLKRELKEELGIVTFVAVYERTPFIYIEKGLRWHVHPYLCKVKDTIEVIINKEHDAFLWVEKDAILKMDHARPLKYELNKIYAQ